MQIANHEAVLDLLQARRRQLLEDKQTRSARVRDIDARIMPPGELDEGDVDDIDVKLLELTSDTLRAVDDALEHLQSGRYGICTWCRTRIAAARLRAVPFATSCRRCESVREGEAAYKGLMSRWPRVDHA